MKLLVIVFYNNKFVTVAILAQATITLSVVNSSKLNDIIMKQSLIIARKNLNEKRNEFMENVKKINCLIRLLPWSDEDDSYTPITVWDGLNTKRKEFTNKVEEIGDLIRLLPVSDECDDWCTPNTRTIHNQQPSRHSSCPAHSRRKNHPPKPDHE